MHRSDSGDEAQAPKDGEPAEGWFRFGDEPDGAEAADELDGGDAGDVDDAGEARPAVHADACDGEEEDDLAAEPRSVTAHSEADEQVGAEAAASAAEEPEERIAPFVVSATPGGVDPNADDAVFAGTASGEGGRGGFGLVGALTVMLALFGAGMFAISGPRTADAGAVSGGAWMSDVGEAMRLAETEGKPLVVHFTADWCPPCRAMRDAVFTSGAVQERLARDFITVRVDLTERGGANDRIAQQFNVRSIPDIQVFHPGGWQLGQFGYVGSGGEFLGRLDDAVR